MRRWRRVNSVGQSLATRATASVALAVRPAAAAWRSGCRRRMRPAQGGQNLARLGVGEAVAELGGDHRPVADVVVDVAGDEVVPGRPNINRFRQASDLQRPSARVRRLMQDAQGFMGGDRPGIVGVQFGVDLDQHLSRRRKAGQGVDMIVGDVGALDPRRPDHLARADGGAQPLSDLVGAQARIAIVVHPATGVGHHGPGAVVLQPALFADHAAVDQRQAQPRRHTLGDPPVVGVALLVSPAVEADERDRQPAVGAPDEGRAAVPAPQVVSRDVPQLDAAAEPCAIQAPRAGRRHHGHRLVLADRIGDSEDVRLHGGKVAGAIDVDADGPLHQLRLSKLGRAGPQRGPLSRLRRSEAGARPVSSCSSSPRGRRPAGRRRMVLQRLSRHGSSSGRSESHDGRDRGRGRRRRRHAQYFRHHPFGGRSGSRAGQLAPEGSGAAVHLGLRGERGDALDPAQDPAGPDHFLRRAEPRLDDRGHPPRRRSASHLPPQRP
uniref:LigA n=1 Tax=Parastrongyloides trichosuri TaxID=131310 RepID=A0A0N4ZIZ7_PARTI